MLCAPLIGPDDLAARRRAGTTWLWLLLPVGAVYGAVIAELGLRLAAPRGRPAAAGDPGGGQQGLRAPGGAGPAGSTGRVRSAAKSSAGCTGRSRGGRGDGCRGVIAVARARALSWASWPYGGTARWRRTRRPAGRSGPDGRRRRPPRTAPRGRTRTISWASARPSSPSRPRTTRAGHGTWASSSQWASCTQVSRDVSICRREKTGRQPSARSAITSAKNSPRAGLGRSSGRVVLAEPLADVGEGGERHAARTGTTRSTRAARPRRAPRPACRR